MTRKPTMLGALSLLGLLSILCLLAAAAGAQTPSPPIFLGSGQGCLPTDPQLARHPEGGFVAAWVDAQTLHLRRFDRFGAALGSDRTLSGSVQSFSPPSLAVSADGAVAVTVHSEEAWRLDILSPELFLIDTVELEGVRPNGRALVAAEGEDGFVAVLQRQNALAITRFDTQGQPRGAVLERPSAEEGKLMDLLVQPDGDLWLATGVGQLVTSPPSGRLNLLRMAADTGELKQRNEGLLLLRTASLAAATGDEVALVLGTGAEITLIRLDDTLERVAEPTLVAERQSQGAEISALELTSDPSGNLLVVWSEGPGFLDEPPVIFLQALSPEGEPEGPVTEAAISILGFVPPTLAATSLAGGEAMVAWAGVELIALVPIPCEDAPGPHAVRTPFGGAESLLLGDGRFRVEVDWNAALQGTTGRGRARPDSDDSGSFWFFDPANVELTVKVIDGRPVNGHFWFFYGALSDVSYRIVVTDQLTGFSKSYDNPQGRFGSFADTLAFAEP